MESPGDTEHPGQRVPGTLGPARGAPEHPWGLGGGTWEQWGRAGGHQSIPGREAQDPRASISPANGATVTLQRSGTLIPMEIAMMRKVRSDCSTIIQLLHWFELPDSFLLVLERPEPSQDLFELIRNRTFVPESPAQGIFLQVLRAVRHCHSRGVLHRDIKSKNIIIHLVTGKVKLIDFGCSTLLRNMVYTKFSGERTAQGASSSRQFGKRVTCW